MLKGHCLVLVGFTQFSFANEYKGFLVPVEVPLADCRMHYPPVLTSPLHRWEQCRKPEAELVVLVTEVRKQRFKPYGYI